MNEPEMIGVATAASIQKLQDEIRHLRGRDKSSSDQFVWLASWCHERFGVENNDVIGAEGWPNTITEVVAQVVDSEIERLKADLAACNTRFEHAALSATDRGCVLSVIADAIETWKTEESSNE